jgi:hypothetical protein
VGRTAAIDRTGSAQVPEGLIPTAWQAVQSLVSRLTATDGAEGNFFGERVSVSGDTALVGAFLAELGGNIRQGAAYGFSGDQGGPDAWGRVAKLTASGGAAWSYLGVSVSIDGDTALAGAYGADGGKGFQGAAYVFSSDGHWAYLPLVLLN